MLIDVLLSPSEGVRPLRALHQREMNCQIILDCWLGRGWTDPYLLRIDGRVVGYGLISGSRGEPKDTITEFFVLPAFRGQALALFQKLAAAGRARKIETQTNDPLLSLMLYDYASQIETGSVLFSDMQTTRLDVPAASFRRAVESDAWNLFAHHDEPAGGWVIEADGRVVATGGMLFHYNPPYGDLFMEVDVVHRRRGYGSYLVQELKRTCYELGKVPTARCNPSNHASRATLQKAGLLPCARLLTGVLAG